MKSFAQFIMEARFVTKWLCKGYQKGTPEQIKGAIPEDLPIGGLDTDRAVGGLAHADSREKERGKALATIMQRACMKHKQDLSFMPRGVEQAYLIYSRSLDQGVIVDARFDRFDKTKYAWWIKTVLPKGRKGVKPGTKLVHVQ